MRDWDAICAEVRAEFAAIPKDEPDLSRRRCRDAIFGFRVLPVADLFYGSERASPEWRFVNNRGVTDTMHAIRDDIQANGMRNPLLVMHEIVDYAHKYRVKVGNQRLWALRELGIEEASCVVIDRAEVVTALMERYEEVMV